jgi:septal ring factor EnvC (AmiA/AmiB activator)
MASRTNLKSSTLLSAVLMAGSIGLYSGAFAAEPADEEKAKAADEQSQQIAQKAETPEAKREVKVKKELGATATTETNSHGVPVQDVSAKKDQMNKETAKAVNKVPGVNLKQADLQPPADDPPIKGFHPIKKLLQPVVRLEKNSVQLQQQIMKLEGPIGALQPAMLGLHSKMDGVDKRMVSMQGNLSDMSTQVKGVSGKMDGVRQDITGMRIQIKGLEVPIRQLQKPLNDLKEPLSNVAQPLQEVQKELSDMRALLATVLGAIVLAAVCIAVGTPIAAVLIYKHRRTLFPTMRDHDFPVAKESDKTKEPAHV